MRFIGLTPTRLADLRDNRKGVTAMEYGLIAAAMVGFVGVAFALIGTDTTTLFDKVSTALTAAGG